MIALSEIVRQSKKSSELLTTAPMSSPARSSPVCAHDLVHHFPTHPLEAVLPTIADVFRLGDGADRHAWHGRTVHMKVMTGNWDTVNQMRQAESIRTRSDASLAAVIETRAIKVGGGVPAALVLGPNS